jgi:hypothetical protein
VVIATLAGPVIAVQTQKLIERATASQNQRRWIFEVIMSNRATRLTDENVRALNLIDLAYRRRHDRKVIAAWRSLFGELTQGIRDGETDIATINAWNGRCSDRYVALQAAMSHALSFNFTEEESRRGIYYPKGHDQREAAHLAILHNAALVLSGASALKMAVTELPVAPEAAALQVALTEKMAKAYAEDGALRVRMVVPDKSPTATI